MPGAKKALKFQRMAGDAFYVCTSISDCVLNHFSCVQLFVTLWTRAHQAPLWIVQARILEWVAMPSSKGSSQPRDQTQVSYISCIGRWVLYGYLGSPHLFCTLAKFKVYILILNPSLFTCLLLQNYFNDSISNNDTIEQKY